MAFFDGIEFGERGAGGGTGFQGRARQAATSEVTIPAGGVVIMSLHDGEGVSPFAVACQGTEAALIDLRGRVGQSGELEFAGGIFAVRLVAITSVEQVVDGINLWRWQMEFLA